MEDSLVYLTGGKGVAALVNVHACGEQFVVECVVWLDTDGHDYYVSCERKSASVLCTLGYQLAVFKLYGLMVVVQPHSLVVAMARLKAGFLLETQVGHRLGPGREHIDNVETVMLLCQQKPDDYIDVELDLDKLDATSVETRSTYREIREYVREHSGLNVSNLYISQVKRKLGLGVGESYNKPKSQDAKVQVCPPNKESAIIDALKHFNMV